VVRPDPIPNSAVKHSIADGSSPIGSARVGSRQSFIKTPKLSLRRFALLPRKFWDFRRVYAGPTVRRSDLGYPSLKNEKGLKV
jgi:hypothetical protein